MPEFCVDHLGRWGIDPTCRECRTLAGQPRRSPRGTFLMSARAVIAAAIAPSSR